MMEPTSRERRNEDDASKLERFKKDVTTDASNSIEQRDQANEDMRFIHVQGGQWEGFLEDTFADRVKLEFDTVTNFKNRQIANWNNNRIGVEFQPDDSHTSEDDAKLLTAIYRADWRDGSGKEATDNAVDEALSCGFGALHMRPEYEDPDDPENDAQRVVWEPVYEAWNRVFYDRSAKRADKRDARWVTLLTPYSRDAFLDQWPDKTPSSAYTPTDRNEFNYQQGMANYCYVATRYEVIKKKTRCYLYANLQTGEVETYDHDDHELVKDELRISPIHRFMRDRRVTRRHVEMSRFTGAEFIEKPRKIAGKWLGVIPFYGYRSYIDGQEWWRGVVRKLKDAARIINVQLSQFTESAAGGGNEVPIFDPDQVANPHIRNLWANKTNKPYLLAKALRDASGNVVAQGPTAYTRPQNVAPAAAALLEFSTGYMRDVTGGAPQDTMDPDASGKAIQALMKREDANTQDMFDNIACAIEYSGDVYQSLASEIYNRPQIVRTLGRDNTPGMENLYRVVWDQDTGKLVESNRLNGRKFKAYAETGPQYDTMREQTVEELKGAIDMLAKAGAGQEYIPDLIAIMLENSKGVGLGPLKKKIRRGMLLSGTAEPETDEERAMVAQAAQGQGPNPQEALMLSEAERAQAEARSLDATAMQRQADAAKKMAETRQTEAETLKTEAETAETVQNIQTERARSLREIREEVMGRASQGFGVLVP